MTLRAPLDAKRLALWLLVTLAAAGLASMASVNAPSFYAQLDKPPWAPPAGAFGPVWSVLYVAMATAAWLVSRENAAPGRPRALLLYTCQLAVNALWSWLFFGLQRGALSFADTVVLAVLVAATVASFWRVRRLAAVLLLPYLAWVVYACALNFSVWQRNPALLG